MGHVALQRVVVRMMFDPAFRDRVLADPVGTVGDEDLTEEECGWLAVPDPRALAADDTFRLRSLYALAGELPAATAVAIRRRPELPMAFFGSDSLHACIREGTPLTGAYGTYLAAEPGPWRPLAVLESALAALRRRPIAPVAPPWRLHPSRALIETSCGAGDGLSQVLKALESAPDPATGALDRSLRVRVPAMGIGPRETLLALLEPDGSSSMEVLPEGLIPVLRLAEAGATRTELIATLVDQGADEAEAKEILDDLVADEVIVRSE